ncbi:hypothetical protein D3C76_1491880 [compost metagenome]
MPVSDSTEQRGPLAAVRRAVGGIFDVAAVVDMAVLIQQGSTDAETGIWYICIGSGLNRFLKK